MIGRAMANEFAKMRRLRVLPVVAVMVVGVVALTSFQSASTPPFATQPWQSLIGGMHYCTLMFSPILLAVLASRPVDIEHQGNGWLLSQGAGLTPGYLCRIKFATTGAVVILVTLAQSGLVFAMGKLLGAKTVFPVQMWLGFTALIMVLNLALFIVHLLLSALVKNQLVGLGVGVLGVFLTVSSSGMPDWMAHLLPPWGFYSLVDFVAYRNNGLVWVTPWTFSVLGMGAAAGALLILVTRHFDRREA